MEDDEGYWVCVKNQFNQSPKLEFSVLFHARYEDNASVPVGECFVLKNNDTHCLQEGLYITQVLDMSGVIQPLYRGAARH